MSTRPHRIVVLGLEPVIGYDLTIPPQIFGEAVAADGSPLYDIAIATLDGRPVRATRGYRIAPDHDASVLATADTIVVPGTQLPGPRTDGSIPPGLLRALSLAPTGVRWVSICTGAFVLAAAGLLDGRRATTHWKYADQFGSLYPAVDLDVDVLFTDEGDLLTSAGLSAGIDLCLHIVRKDHGAATANAVARHMVVPPWRDGGQAQFIDRAVPARDDASTAAARQWALEHLDQPIDVPLLARRATMSVRTFTRRFREETGMSPAAWLIQQRVRHAQHLLEETDLSIDQVADRAGIGTAASLRAHLQAVAGVSPSGYRRSFRGARVLDA